MRLSSTEAAADEKKKKQVEYPKSDETCTKLSQDGTAGV